MLMIGSGMLHGAGRGALRWQRLGDEAEPLRSFVSQRLAVPEAARVARGLMPRPSLAACPAVALLVPMSLHCLLPSFFALLS